MSVTLEDLQPFVDKEAIFHLIKDDGSTDEITGTIKAATVAGVPYKVKGKAGLELTTVDKFYEITYAPIKEKAVSQKKINPIEFGQARQHLVDRHGVELSWAKDASEKDAFEWHASLDHSNLGHAHYTQAELDEKKKKADEKAAVESGAGY